MNAEEELKALRHQVELRDVTYKKRRKRAKFIYIGMGMITLFAYGYGSYNKAVADEALAVAEAGGAQALQERSSNEQALAKCRSDLESLNASLTECQSKSLKK